jgi:hypothetical protein
VVTFELASVIRLVLVTWVRAGQELNPLASPAILIYVILMDSAIRNLVKKVGRPPIGDKAAKMHAMRLPDELLDELDAYADREGLKTRSEAIRALLEAALKADAKKRRR